MALVALADGQVLISAGSQRQAVYRVDAQGGRAVTPLFELNSPIYDMAVDALGQLWVLTGQALLQVDINSGTVLRTVQGLHGEPLTHALAIHQATGNIYVSSGNGIEIFNPNESDVNKAWKHFSNQRVGDLAFGHDGRLWAVVWTGSDIYAAYPNPTTDIVSFSLTGREAGRAALEYRLAGIIDSIAFGQVDSPLDGVLVASSQLKQRAVNSQTASTTPHQSSVWMIELASKRVLQVASGGTRGESLITTADGRILVAQSQSVDEIAPAKAPKVTVVSIADGSVIALPLSGLAVTFDQAMWTGENGADLSTRQEDLHSVLNRYNYRLVGLGVNQGQQRVVKGVHWDAASHSAVLDISDLSAGQWQLELSSGLHSEQGLAIKNVYTTSFTAVADMSQQLSLRFVNTRADRATGSVSYDVDVTNIGIDDIRGPLTLLLNPQTAFGGAVEGAVIGSGLQDGLWLLDLSAGLQAFGNKLPVGATLASQTVTLRPLSALSPALVQLMKADMGHQLYALPQANIPPSIGVPLDLSTIEPELLSDLSAEELAELANIVDLENSSLKEATVGQTWTQGLTAIDTDGILLHWQLLSAPAGVTLVPVAGYTSHDEGYHFKAQLQWTPTAQADAETEIVVRVTDSRGGTETKRFYVNVIGGNHAPSIDFIREINIVEGETLRQTITASDLDSDYLTFNVENLPAGAVFDAQNKQLIWTPDYNQAGQYQVTLVVTDGIKTVRQTLDILVDQARVKPFFAEVPAAVFTRRSSL